MTEVVAALIWDKDKFMICQRPTHKVRGLLWEFVSGKVEPSETKKQALIREFQEELAVTLSVGDVFMDIVHEYPELTVHFTLFNATIVEGVPRKIEHNDIKWIMPSEIPNYEFCPADEEILSRIIEMYSCNMRKNTIEKLVYKREFLDLSVMKIGAKTVTTITADGNIILKEYKFGSRKAESVQNARCSVVAFKKLCYDIETCVETADRLDFYVDDSSEGLKIYHKFGRVQLMDRGLGNEERNIGAIMHEFLDEVL